MPINSDKDLSVIPPRDTVKVWDPVVRIGHWTLVLAFFIAYFTEDDEVISNITLALVILHVAGGLLSSYMYKENLIRAMITGRKRP